MKISVYESDHEASEEDECKEVESKEEEGEDIETSPDEVKAQTWEPNDVLGKLLAFIAQVSPSFPWGVV